MEQKTSERFAQAASSVQPTPSDKPRFHIAPPEGWLNDPNGPCIYNGTYHMCFQHLPGSAQWGFNLVWAHVASTDMVHWHHLPHALVPTPGSVDADGCFSGCAAVDRDGRPCMLYTGIRLRGSTAAGPLPPPECDLGLPFVESQCIAYAEDPKDPKLTHWRTVGTPIIALPPANIKLTGWRDPYLIGPPSYQPGLGYTMLMGSGIKEVGGSVLVYLSEQLDHGWQLVGELCSGVNWGENHGFVWECPLLVRLPLLADSTAPAPTLASITNQTSCNSSVSGLASAPALGSTLDLPSNPAADNRTFLAPGHSRTLSTIEEVAGSMRRLDEGSSDGSDLSSKATPQVDRASGFGSAGQETAGQGMADQSTRVPGFGTGSQGTAGQEMVGQGMAGHSTTSRTRPVRDTFFCISPDACTNPALYYLGAFTHHSSPEDEARSTNVPSGPAFPGQPGSCRQPKFLLKDSLGPFRLDLGDIAYAPNTLLDERQGRVLLWAWMQEQRRMTGTFTHAGCLSVPRELWLECGSAPGDQSRLVQRPPVELAALRIPGRAWVWHDPGDPAESAADDASVQESGLSWQKSILRRVDSHNSSMKSFDGFSRRERNCTPGEFTAECNGDVPGAWPVADEGSVPSTRLTSYKSGAANWDDQNTVEPGAPEGASEQAASEWNDYPCDAATEPGFFKASSNSSASLANASFKEHLRGAAARLVIGPGQAFTIPELEGSFLDLEMSLQLLPDTPLASTSGSTTSSCYTSRTASLSGDDESDRRMEEVELGGGPGAFAYTGFQVPLGMEEEEGKKGVDGTSDRWNVRRELQARAPRDVSAPSKMPEGVEATSELAVAEHRAAQGSQQGTGQPAGEGMEGEGPEQEGVPRRRAGRQRRGVPRQKRPKDQAGEEEMEEGIPRRVPGDGRADDLPPEGACSGLLLRAWQAGVEGAAAVLYCWSTQVLEVVFEALDPVTHEYSLAAPGCRRVGGRLQNPPAPGEPLVLRVLLDFSLLEVFTLGGEVLSTRVYRGVPPPGVGSGVELVSIGCSTRVLATEAYEMASCWVDDLPYPRVPAKQTESQPHGPLSDVQLQALFAQLGVQQGAQEQGSPVHTGGSSPIKELLSCRASTTGELFVDEPEGGTMSSFWPDAVSAAGIRAGSAVGSEEDDMAIVAPHPAALPPPRPSYDGGMDPYTVHARRSQELRTVLPPQVLTPQGTIIV